MAIVYYTHETFKWGVCVSVWAFTYDDETAVDETEGAGAADAGAAVDDRRPVRGVEHAGLAHPLQELQEGDRRRRDPEVGPRGVVVLDDVAARAALHVAEPGQAICS